MESLMSINSRPSWDQYFMDMADLVSTRGTCDRKRVGAVIVKNKRVIASGYNGSIPGMPHCDDPETYMQCTKCGVHFPVKTDKELLTDPRYQCLSGSFACLGYPIIERHGGHDMENNSCQRTIHAEVNAIAQAARMGISTEDATIFCNTYPCWNCMKTIVSAGIVEVVYKDAYRKNRRVEDAAKAISGFILRQI